MSALPSSEEIRLAIKVKTGMKDAELKKKFEEYALGKYSSYRDSSEIIWFLLAKHLDVPVTIDRGTASRPAVELAPKEDFIRLKEFDISKHFLFNARGYILEKWPVNATKMRGNLYLGDETEIEKVAVFVEQEPWFNEVEVGDAVHFQGLGFMDENTDDKGKTWPRTLRTGYRTVITSISPNEFELPPLEETTISLNEVEHLLDEAMALLRGVVLEAGIEDRYIGCPRPECYKGTGVNEGDKVRCEKCGHHVAGVQLRGLGITLQDAYETPIRVRFMPWFDARDYQSLEGKDILILGSYSTQYKRFDGTNIILTQPSEVSGPPTRKEADEFPLTIDDLDFSRDKDPQSKKLNDEETKEYLDMVSDIFPELFKAIGGATAEMFSTLVEAKFGERVQVKGIIEKLIEGDLWELRTEEESGEAKIYLVE